MFRRCSFAVGVLALCAAAPARAQDFDPNYTGTFSIIALDPAAGELGMAGQSKAFAVGNRTISGKGGVAVIAHQANSDPMYGALALQLLGAGMTPKDALDLIVRGDAGRENRQVSILDINGYGASWIGGKASDWKGDTCGVHYCAQGNPLAGPEVLGNLAKTFESTTGPLADRWTALASAYLKGNRKADGLAALAKAIELNPSVKKQAQKNTNFNSLRDDPDFLRLVSP